ncbi:NADPH-dependent FMN reductase [Pigmentiphaga sp. NML080357]|uniref:NADPH-dependent FMN reductase n=1 Tax=Pigmentiphaga sp. NML080357 TaxID=2008675 RepID=UPI000B41BD87|nr:NAD(P)H-dependent oxidoreductase [Pigmentiphaga sp. NML080357]OVZ64877.1 NADPH-dependent FMN reductase [Pigmentiphaga sp. NML080357]
MDANTQGARQADEIRILGICGSLRRRSYNRMALLAARELMPAGMSMELADLDAIPMYSGDLEAEGFPEPVRQLAARIRDADGLLIASPEYNFSVSGVLKNGIDWLSRLDPQPFRHKPAALLSATQGPVGGARNQYDLRKILGCLEAQVLLRPEVFIGLCHTKFDAGGRLADAPTRKVLGDQMTAFAAWTRCLRGLARP